MFKGKKNQWLEVYGKTLVIRTPRPGQQEKPSLKLGFPRTTSQLYGELYGDPWRLTPSVCGNLGLLDHQSLLIHCSWAMGRPCCRNEAFDSSVSELWDSGILQSARFPQHHMFPEASRADLSNARARSLWAGSVSSILIEQLTSCVTKGNCGSLRFFTYQMKIVTLALQGSSGG